MKNLTSSSAIGQFRCLSSELYNATKIFMNIKDAKKIATEFINQNLENFDYEDEFVIMDDVTIEKEYGWIFSYNSKKIHRKR
jgi:hypothetical protein